MQLDFGWLKRLMPRGLYGRAALILFLPLVVVTMVVAVMFLQRHFEDVTQQMSESMARELSFVSRRIERTDDAATAAIAGTQLAAPLGVTLRIPPDGPARDARAFYDLSGRVVARTLRENLPQIRAVDLSDRKRVVATLEGRWGPYQLSFERERVSASNPHQLLVLMLLTSLLMSAIASIFLRNQLRPIRRLARAAEDYGKGRITPYRPSGASEVRSAGTAFLDMRNRIERLNEQRRLMLSGISHDLRTPLTRLQLGLSMMGPDLPPESDEIADLQRDVAQMSRMVEAFMDFARDTVHDSPAEAVAVGPFLAQIVADAQRSGQDLQLRTLDGIAGPEDCNAVATFRPDALRRAIENLIGNAVRYGSRAEISAQLGPRSLRVRVEDDGPGIPPDQIEDALRPFSRLDPARNQNRGEGVGLGLAIAADIARAHGGQLRLSHGDSLGGLRAELVIAR